MRHVLLVLVVASALVTGATAALAPTRVVVEPRPITALSLTRRSVVYAVGENASGTACAYLKLWNTSTRGLWRFGDSTTRVCREGPSTGSGISAVATSGRRVFWITFVGGNVREFTLWTATPGRRAPRRLADGSSDVDSDDPAIVLGDGSGDGVPYAEGDTVTFVADSGARLFRRQLASLVRIVVAGEGPDGARVVAALDDGSVVTLADDGRVLSTTAPGAAVSALEHGQAGPIVQRGRTVSFGSTAVVLPAGALMLGAGRGALVYARRGEVRARDIATGADVLLNRLSVEPGARPLFTAVPGGAAWARDRTVSWAHEPPP